MLSAKLLSFGGGAVFNYIQLLYAKVLQRARGISERI